MKKRLLIFIIALGLVTVVKAEKDVENIIQQVIQQSQFNTEDNQKQSTESETTEETTTEDAKEEERAEEVGPKEDVSDGSKFVAYDNYERSALATGNSETIYKMAQLYFKDGLFERAVNVSKRDTRGDLRNLFVVAIGSRLIGDYDQSIDYYNRILSRTNNAEARLGRGIAYKSKGEFNKALNDLRAYANVNPTAEVRTTIEEINSILASK